jgi:hypothetical protein
LTITWSSTMSEPTPGTPTGDGAVDGAVAPLRHVGELPLRDQVAVFEAVHAALQERLAEPDS